MQAACICEKRDGISKRRGKLVVYVSKMCVRNSVYRGPQKQYFSPENLRGAPGWQDPGSLQIKENDVYMRKGCLSRFLLPTGSP